MDAEEEFEQEICSRIAPVHESEVCRLMYWCQEMKDWPHEHERRTDVVRRLMQQACANNLVC